MNHAYQVEQPNNGQRIDHQAEFVEERELVNTPIAALYPNEPFVIIDWMASTKNRPSVEDLQAPLAFQDKNWHGAYYWGSAVKDGATLGFLHDFLVESGLVKLNEDGQRVQRAMIAEGLYGGLEGDFKIQIVPAGTVVPGVGPVEDGFGYIRRELAETGHSGLDKISLGYAKESYTFWQRIPWTAEIAKEFSPVIAQTMVEMSDISAILMDYTPVTFEEKRALVKADASMLEHPFIANALARASGEMLARAATTAKTKVMGHIAVPTTAPQACWPNHYGNTVIYRYPIDAWGSIQAITLEPQAEEDARIINLEVVQVSITSKSFTSKGCLGIVDEIPGGYDIIICSDDVKMSVQGVPATRRLDHIDLDGVVVVFTQWFKKGCAFGVNASWAKNRMGLDHDGDMIFAIEANPFPALFSAVQRFPKDETPKLDKSKELISKQDKRAEMIRQSMMNLVGFASNLASATFVVSDRESLANDLGFNSAQAMDKALNYFIKVGTDGFKTNIDQEPIRRHMSVIQSKLQRQFGVKPPWVDWPNENAFRQMVPMVGIPVDVQDTKTAKEMVKPFMDGTIAEICRLTLPSLGMVLETPIKVRPLTNYRPWADHVSSHLYEQAKTLQDAYTARSQRVNWSDPNSIGKFKIFWQAAVDEWIAVQGLDRMQAASALWKVAHSARSENAGAGSAFMGMPLEAYRIVVEKPGAALKMGTIITGLHYQLPGVDSLEAQVEVVDVHTSAKGKDVIRKCLVATVPGQVAPQNTSYPAQMIAMVAQNADQPQAGTYQAHIRKSSNAAWTCELTTN